MVIPQTPISQEPSPAARNDEVLPGGLTPNEVGMEFVRQYYTLMNEAPNFLYRLYTPDSKFVHGNITGKNQLPIVGQSEIKDEIERLNFQQVYTKIRQVDCYSTLHEMLVILICGDISISRSASRRFAQQIVLAPQAPLKYYVVNDVFRYIDEADEPAENDMETESSEGQDEDLANHANLGMNQGGVGNQVGAPASFMSPASQNVGNNQVPAERVNHMMGNDMQQQASGLMRNHAEDHGMEQNMNNYGVEASMNNNAQVNGGSNMHQASPPQDIDKNVRSNAFEMYSQQDNNERADERTPVNDEQQGSYNEVAEKNTEENAQDAAPASDAMEPATNQVPEVKNEAPKSWASLMASGTAAAASPKKPVVNQVAQPAAPSTVLAAESARPEEPSDGFQAAGKPQRGPRPTGGKPGDAQGSFGERPGFDRRNNRGMGAGQFSSASPNQNYNAMNNIGTFPPKSESPGAGNFAQQGGFNNRGRAPAGFGGAPGSFGQQPPDSYQIFVGNLPQDVTIEELKKRFAEYGTVNDVRINRGSGIPFGFVVFDGADPVQKILAITQGQERQNLYLRDEKHRINIEEKKPRSATGGGNLNRGSGGRFPPGGSGPGSKSGSWGNERAPREGGMGGGPGKFGGKGGPGSMGPGPRGGGPGGKFGGGMNGQQQNNNSSYNNNSNQQFSGAPNRR